MLQAYARGKTEVVPAARLAPARINGNTDDRKPDARRRCWEGELFGWCIGAVWVRADSSLFMAPPSAEIPWAETWRLAQLGLSWLPTAGAWTVGVVEARVAA